jgi:flavin-binding protein dodecin
MAVVKVIELIAESPKSWEDAAQQGLQQAAQTVRGIKSMWVSEFQAMVVNNQITAYRVNVKVSFMIEAG